MGSCLVSHPSSCKARQSLGIYFTENDRKVFHAGRFIFFSKGIERRHVPANIVDPTRHFPCDFIAKLLAWVTIAERSGKLLLGRIFRSDQFR